MFGRAASIFLILAILSALLGCTNMFSHSNNQPTTTPVSGSAQGTLTISPGSLNFGSVSVGSSSSLTGTLASSDVPVVVSSGAWSGTGFSVTGINFPLAIGAGQTATYTVTFTPSSAASSSGTLRFVSNASNPMLQQTFMGTGTQAPPSQGTLTVSPSTLNFGNVAVGNSSSLDGTLTASNASIVVSSAAWNGSGFSISGITFPFTIAAGTTASYTVTFAPASVGASSGAISFSSNAADATAQESFAGTGTQLPPPPHTVALAWTASTSSVAGYNVYRSSVSGGPYIKLNSSLVSATTYVDSLVQSGSTYYYVATAVDTSNVEGGYSNQAMATIP